MNYILMNATSRRQVIRDKTTLPQRTQTPALTPGTLVAPFLPPRYPHSRSHTRRQHGKVEEMFVTTHILA